jgi:hypothetical protein
MNGEGSPPPDVARLFAAPPGQEASFLFMALLISASVPAFAYDTLNLPNGCGCAIALIVLAGVLKGLFALADWIKGWMRR